MVNHSLTTAHGLLLGDMYVNMLVAHTHSAGWYLPPLTSTAGQCQTLSWSPPPPLLAALWVEVIWLVEDGKLP